MNFENTLVLDGIHIQRRSLVYDTREVFGRFSNYIVLFNESSAFEVLEKLNCWSEAVRRSVFRVTSVSRSRSSTISVVLDDEVSGEKSMGFFERMLFPESEKYGELVIHLSVDGVKRFLKSLKSLIEAGRAGSDFDFRFHPFECDYVSSGLVSLTICCGNDWMEKMKNFDEETMLENSSVETTNLSAIEYFRAAQKFASLK